MQISVTKDSIDALLEEHKQHDSEMIGAWVEIISPWYYLNATKPAIILIGEREIILVQLGFFSLKPVKTEKCSFSEIKKVAVSKWLLASRIDISLKNNKKIKLQIRYKSAGFNDYQKNSIVRFENLKEEFKA